MSRGIWIGAEFDFVTETEGLFSTVGQCRIEVTAGSESTTLQHLLPQILQCVLLGRKYNLPFTTKTPFFP